MTTIYRITKDGSTAQQAYEPDEEVRFWFLLPAISEEGCLNTTTSNSHCRTGQKHTRFFHASVHKLPLCLLRLLDDQSMLHTNMCL